MRLLPPLKSLRVFEEAGNHLSFTKAAETLHVTQGAVSQQIKLLEDYLGTPLFVRTSRRLELSDAGRQLLPQLHQAFNLLEMSIEGVRDPNQRQKLSILAPPTFSTRWLVPRLTDFRKRFPELQLTINDHEAEGVSYDCSIRFGRTARARYFSEMLMLEKHVAVCAPELLPPSGNLNISDQNLLHILHHGKRLPVWDDWVRETNASIDPRQGTEFSTLDQVINAAVSGAGVALIDRRMIKRELEAQALMIFSDVEVQGPYGYWLDISTDKQGLAKVVHFVEWLREIVR
ncbi:LysR substrate-binding domain-containing protein [Halomonas sp. NCCP-2165]|nr:LysR substrate-binding domain-containing protein [Halomonas sp. NCCP-2165]GKW47940.1 LysR family transcriptional regulator [Halomonas sp. NCCP-2165]